MACTDRIHAVALVLCTGALTPILSAQEAQPNAGAVASPANEPIRFFAKIGFAAGEYEHKTVGSNLSDDVEATLVHLNFDAYSRSGFGGGFRLELTNTGDDLFADKGLPASEIGAFDLFGYFAYRLGEDRGFTMPIRGGFFANVLEMEESLSSNSVEWTTFGFRGSVEPDLPLLRWRNGSWNLFANLSLGAGATVIETDPLLAAGIDEFDSSAATFGFDLGMRVHAGNFFAELAYVHRELLVDESDTQGILRIREIEDRFDGISLAVGVRF